MEVILGLAILGMVCWWSIILLPWRPWSTREKLVAGEIADASALPSSLSGITVLIPARNESAYIGRTLQAVNSQGKGMRIIVINDQSGDDTPLQAKANSAEVLAGTAPPPEWSGKLWALEQGLKKVKTPYTLLLDADIELAPGVVRALLHKAQSQNIALVSLMATPPLINFTERLLMPAFIFFFKLLYPFRLANKSLSRIAAAAGGCILIETQALRAIGAFANLHDALIDDCTLAGHVKRAGLRTWIGLSHAAQSHRGYEGLAPIWEMVARTAYTQLRYSFLLLILCTIIMGSMFWAAPFIFLWIPTEAVAIISLLAWSGMLLSYLPTLIYYQRSPLWAAALPIIGTLYLAMTWTSAIRYWRGERASWKDRRYESKTTH